MKNVTIVLVCLLFGLLCRISGYAQFVPLSGQKYYLIQSASGLALGERTSDARAALYEPLTNASDQQFEFIESHVAGQYFIKSKNNASYLYVFDSWKMGFKSDTLTNSDSFRFTVSMGGGDTIYLQSVIKTATQYISTDAITVGSGVFPDKTLTARAVWKILTPDKVSFVTKLKLSEAQKIEIEKGYKSFPLSITGTNVSKTAVLTASTGFSVSPNQISAESFSAGTAIQVTVDAPSAEIGTEGQLFISFATATDTLAFDTIALKSVSPYKRYLLVQNTSGFSVGITTGDPTIPRLSVKNIYDPYQLFFLRPVNSTVDDSTYYLVRDADYGYFNKTTSNSWDTNVGALEQGTWKIVKEANGFYSLKNLSNNKYCATDGTTIGSRLYADKAFADNPKADWILEEPNYLPVENQIYYLVQKASGLPLGERATDSRALLLEANIYDKAEQLTVVKSPVEGQYFVKNTLTGYLYFFDSWKMGFKADTGTTANDFRFEFTPTLDGYLTIHAVSKAADEIVGSDAQTAGSGVYPNKKGANDRYLWRFLKAEEVGFEKSIAVSSDSLGILKGDTVTITINVKNIAGDISIEAESGFSLSDTTFTPSLQPFELKVAATGEPGTTGTINISGEGFSKTVILSIISTTGKIKVGYFTFDKNSVADATKHMDASAAQPNADPVYNMLNADQKLEVTLNLLSDITATATADLSVYDVVVIQESFDSKAGMLTPAGALGLSKINKPVLYNKNYAFAKGRAITTGSGAGSELTGCYSIHVDATRQSHDLFKGFTFKGDSVDIFKSGATDLGAAGTKALNYAKGVVLTAENTMLALPNQIKSGETAVISFNDLPSGSSIDSEVLAARMITFGMNYGAICKENGTNLTDEGLTLWRNAVYLLAGLDVPAQLVEAPAKLRLKHSYTFEDGTAKDVIGGADGTLVGGTIANGAYTAAANGEYINLPAEKIAINTYSAITLELFISTDIKNNDGNRMISFFGNTTGTYGTDYLFISHKSRAAISCKNTATPWSAENGFSGELLDNADSSKHHLVSILTNDTIKLFVDGVFAGSSALSADNKIANLGNSFAYLCKSGYPGDKTWLGSIHEYNIYSGILSAEEIKTHSTAFRGKSTNANLASLSLDKGTLSPAFSADVTTYTINMPTGTTSATITAKTADAMATVSGTGEVTFTATGKTADIVVTAEDGTSKTYNITITVGVSAGEFNMAQIRLYPNPVINSLTVEGVAEGASLKIFNQAGQQLVIQTANGGSQHINLEGFQKGIYLLWIESNGKTTNTMFIKK